MMDRASEVLRIRILSTFDPRSSIHYANYALPAALIPNKPPPQTPDWEIPLTQPSWLGNSPPPALLAWEFPSPNPLGWEIPLTQPSWLGNSPPKALLAGKFLSPSPPG